MTPALPYVVEVRRKDERDNWRARAAFDRKYRAKAFAAPLLKLNSFSTYPWKYRVTDLTDANRER